MRSLIESLTSLKLLRVFKLLKVPNVFENLRSKVAVGYILRLTTIFKIEREATLTRGLSSTKIKIVYEKRF